MPSNRVRITDLKARKRRGEKIAMLTAYDATMAALLERAGVDTLLVGDSVGMAVLGYDSTIPVTLDAMVHHTAAVVRGTRSRARRRRHAVPYVSGQRRRGACETPADSCRKAGPRRSSSKAAAPCSTSCSGWSMWAFR